MQIVKMTVSSMRCWKNVRLDARLRGAVLALLVAAGLPCQASSGASVDELRVEQTSDGLLLFVQMRLRLAPAVEDALRKGIVVHFLTEAKVMRERWYWSDQQLAAAERYTRLAYQPLTQRWRLNTSSEPISATDLGIGLTQHYDSLDDALVAVQRIAGWKIASVTELTGEGRQYLQFRFRLDSGQLPRTFQLGAVGQPDWHLSLERRIELGAESAR